MNLSMSTYVSHVKGGRVGQKARTLRTMVEATQRLMAEGVIPTVEQAAERAGVSRATAYRYFRNQRELLAASYPIIDLPSLLPSDASGDVVERVTHVARSILRSVVENETALRAQLRMSLEQGGKRTELPLRQGRRIGWFADALSPVKSQMKPAEFRRLTLALASVVSLEVLIWLIDLGGLPHQKAVDQIVWTARRVLDATLATIN
jgi:AcrR family transcriptional regulator